MVRLTANIEGHPDWTMPKLRILQKKMGNHSHETKKHWKMYLIFLMYLSALESFPVVNMLLTFYHMLRTVSQNAGMTFYKSESDPQCQLKTHLLFSGFSVDRSANDRPSNLTCIPVDHYMDNVYKTWKPTVAPTFYMSSSPLLKFMSS